MAGCLLSFPSLFPTLSVLLFLLFPSGTEYSASAVWPLLADTQCLLTLHSGAPFPSPLSLLFLSFERGCASIVSCSSSSALRSPSLLSLILAVPGTLVPLVHCRCCCCCCLVSRALAVLQTTAVVSAGWLAGKAKAWSSFSPSSSSPQTHSLPKLTHSQGTELYWIEPSRTQTDQTRRRAFCSGVCVLSLLKS